MIGPDPGPDPGPVPAFAARTGTALGPGAVVAVLAVGVLLGFAVDPLVAHGVPAPSAAPGMPSASGIGSLEPDATRGQGSAEPARPTPTPAPAPTIAVGATGWPLVFENVARAMVARDVLWIEVAAPSAMDTVWILHARLALGADLRRVAEGATGALTASGAAPLDVLGDGNSYSFAGPAIAGTILRAGTADLVISVEAAALAGGMIVAVPTREEALRRAGCVPMSETTWRPDAASLPSRVSARLATAGFSPAPWTCWRGGSLVGLVLMVQDGFPTRLAVAIRDALVAESEPATIRVDPPMYFVQTADQHVNASVTAPVLNGEDEQNPDQYGPWPWTAIVEFDVADIRPLPTLPASPAP